MTYDVFISYSRLDRAEAVALEQALGQATSANGQFVKVFRDERNLAVGEHVDIALPTAHNASAVVIVLWSDNAAKSKWVHNEAIGAIFGLKYYPLMLDGFEPRHIPEDVRPINAGRLSAALADVPALVTEIERRRPARLPTRLQVESHNSMPTSGQGDVLIGRDVQLAMLHQAWAEGHSHMVVLDAMGGTGKTALINRFLDDLRNQGWGGAERVYAWSFYSQGTDDNRQGDADGFFAAAFDWFGYRGEPVKGAERGRRLAKLIREKRTLVVLDGLEPLQYPAHSPGLEGKLKDDGLAALIKALADQMHGLVVITTRIPIPELKTRAQPAVVRRELNQLSVDHGVTLLKTLGVKASEEHFREVVGLLGGHALSLNLLATYSNTVTNHLLPSAEEIRRLLLDPALGSQAYVMMRRYEILLEDRAQEQATGRGEEAQSADRQLALMYLVGLFDRPVERDVVDVLQAEPIAGLTDALDDLSPTKWKFAVDALRCIKLLLPEAKAGEIDAHPLIREYFGRRLRETKAEAFQAANARLYEHFKLADIPPAYRDPVRYGLVALAAALSAENFEIWTGALIAERFPADSQYRLPPVLRGIAPKRLRAVVEGLDEAGFNGAVRASQPDTIKAMEPLFASIAHGCAAGLQDAAYYEVYRPRVERGNEAHAIKKLGAYGADLSALVHFYDVPFTVPSGNLTPADQYLVLGNTGFRMRAIGRLAEAVEPTAAAFERLVAAKDWRNAASAAANLSQAQLAIGEIGDAVAVGAESVRLADAIADNHPSASFERMYQRTTLADALFCAGDLVASSRLFAEAERRQAAWQQDFPLLYSTQGYRYCDLLLASDEAAEVQRRGSYIHGLAPNSSTNLLDTGLGLLSLGRAALAFGDTGVAAARLEEAVTALEDSGKTDDVPRALLARAALHRITGAWDLAAIDLNASDEIADRPGMKLFQIDSAIERARLSLAREGAAGCAAARSLIARARTLIDETRGRDHEGIERHYAKPTPDIALVEARIALLSAEPEDARRHLAEAQSWIDRSWKSHVPEHAELEALCAEAANAASPNAPTTIPAELSVADADLVGAVFLETYRDCRLFRLCDGRIYLEGLIAVNTLDHARATLDVMAND